MSAWRQNLLVGERGFSSTTMRMPSLLLLLDCVHGIIFFAKSTRVLSACSVASMTFATSMSP